MSRSYRGFYGRISKKLRSNNAKYLAKELNRFPHGFKRIVKVAFLEHGCYAVSYSLFGSPASTWNWKDIFPSKSEKASIQYCKEFNRGVNDEFEGRVIFRSRVIKKPYDYDSKFN